VADVESATVSAPDTEVVGIETLAAAKTETKERTRAYRSSEDHEEWRERALRLQAEMATYRQRQQRIAQTEARVEQVALLKDMLVIADDLERALTAAQTHPGTQHRSDPLTEGVELTWSALQRVLAKYGLEQIEVKGKPFDPAWHDALQVVSATALGVKPGTVVEVLEAGYQRQGALFRPAKVVVAQ
jgi:molecular chaperone GrpE